MDVQSDFDRFWAAYPYRHDKKKARIAWEKLNPSPELVQKILEALMWQRNQPQWLKDDGKYIPLPKTYINGERWNDEPFHVTKDSRSDKFSGLREFVNGG